MNKFLNHRGYFALLWLPLLAFNLYADYKLEEMPNLESLSVMSGLLFFILLTIRCKRIYGAKESMYFVFLWLVAIPINFGLVLLHESYQFFMVINLCIVLGVIYFAILAVTKAIPPADKVAHHPKL